MPNFLPICFVDTFDLVASMRQRMGLFKPGEPRILPIRGPRAEADDPDDDLAYINYRDPLAKWPEMARMIRRLGRIGEEQGGIEFGRIFLEMLDPGMRLSWTLDDNAYAARFTRVHLPLRTNPAAMMHSGIEQANLLPGALTAVNQRAPHSAINLGEWPRVHLVADFRRKDQE